MRGGVVVTVLCALLLTGCTAIATPGTAPSPAPTASVARGDAALARFAAAADRVAHERDPKGLDFVRALEAAGWSRRDLQVTADRTSVGLAVPAVQFAARDGRSCLLGQYGAAGLRVLRASPVDGACLIGQTRDLG